MTPDTRDCDEEIALWQSVGSAFRFCSILTFLLATGCAPSQWEKPGGDVASEENDLLACRQSAQLSVGSDPSLSSRVRPTMAGTGVLAIQASPAMDSERQLREFQATQDCMHAKGYQLKPAQAR